MRAHEIGHVKVWLRDDPEGFLLHPECYSDLKHAWTMGETFYTAKDHYGAPITLKLGAITAIGLSTPSQISEYEADERLHRLELDDR